MTPFCEDSLSSDEKLYLSSLSKHPGFMVLKKLMEDACTQMATKIVKVKPEDPERITKINAYQLEAFAINDFCATLIKSCGWHATNGEIEEENQKLQQTLEGSLVETGQGSIRIKPRKGE